MSDGVEVSVDGRSLVFQTDQSSIVELLLAAEAARSDPEWQPIEWTTAGNAHVDLNQENLGRVISSVSNYRRKVHKHSQDARERILDETKPLIRSASEAIAQVAKKEKKQ